MRWSLSSTRSSEAGTTPSAGANYAQQFVQIDSYVQERLALFNSKKRQKSGRRWGTVHTYAWYQHLGVYRLSGTLRYRASATGVT